MCIFEFNEEKYREVMREDGFNEGLAEGRLQVIKERENSIRLLIRTCRSLNASRQETLKQLSIQYSLDIDTAREYLDMHWD